MTYLDIGVGKLSHIIHSYNDLVPWHLHKHHNHAFENIVGIIRAISSQRIEWNMNYTSDDAS